MSSVVLCLRLSQEGLQIGVENENQGPNWHTVSLSGPQDADYLTSRLIQISRFIFFDLLPHEDISVRMDANLKTMPAALGASETLARLVMSTNEFLLKHSAWKGIGKSFLHLWMYVGEEVPSLETLCRRIQSSDATLARYEVFSTGWDPMERIWKNSNVRSLENLIQTIVETKTGRLVTNNMYLATLCAREGYYLPAILSYIGVDFVTVDYDFYDLTGYATQAAFQSRHSPRYCIEPSMEAPWVKLYKLENVRYHPSLYCLPSSEKLSEVSNDFEVFVASNARLNGVASMIQPILFLLEQTDPQHPYRDLMKMFYTLRLLILESPKLQIDEKEGLNRFIYQLYLSAISFLKYDAIEHAACQRPVKIYGDQAWEALFPDLYQHRYLSDGEYGQITSSGRVLQLLLNANPNYLENNPVYQKAMNLRAPYLGFESMVSTNTWAAFRELEYTNGDHLESLLQKAPELFWSENYRRTREAYENMFREYVDDFAIDMMSRSQERRLPVQWHRELESHVALHETTLVDFLQANRSRLLDVLQRLISGRLTFEISQSRYATCEFLSRIPIRGG